MPRHRARYYLTETMGRSAGWLAYGAAIAGEASLVVSVEDITGKYREEESFQDPTTGETVTRPVMKVEEVIRRIVATMKAREFEEKKEFGVIVIAEGLAEYLPQQYLEGISRDEHGHISISQVNLCRRFAKLIADEFRKVTGKSRRVTGLQLGYEARCCAAARLRRNARQSTGRGRLSRTRRRKAQWRDGLRARPTRSELCPVH